MMKREIVKTGDGSSTIFIPEWNEHYHSKHGALQEAYHVFIRMGLDYYRNRGGSKKDISILEIGFGTGLNTLITLFENLSTSQQIKYTGVEAYPVSEDELAALNYSSLFQQDDAQELFEILHTVPWGQKIEIASNFVLEKIQLFFSDIDEADSYDLIYFDAFGPRVQPELWTEEIFGKMNRALREQGVLVTYSAKGSVRRAMQAVGFAVERLPGPPGKREMLRAIKE